MLEGLRLLQRSNMHCPNCGTSADTGRIFCRKCGAALRVPVSLVSSGSQSFDVNKTAAQEPDNTAAMFIELINLEASTQQSHDCEPPAGHHDSGSDQGWRRQRRAARHWNRSRMR